MAPVYSPPDEPPRKFWARLKDRLSKDNVQGDAHVSAGAIILTALFLMLLTSGLLYGIVRTWPPCEFSKGSANDNAPGNASGNTTSPANGNASLTTSANTNANANANNAANLNNANANTRATNLNTNTNGDVGAGTPTTPSITTPGATTTTTAGNGETKIEVNSVEPKSGPTTGNTLVIIKGKNFGTEPQDLTVKFDESNADIHKVSDESIMAKTPEHSEGPVEVIVERGKEKGVWDSTFTYTCPAPSGTSLFYLIIFSGALGGCIYAMRSFFWYVGQRELKWSWLPRYFSLPFIGAAMALLFGLLIFAGLFVDNKAGRSTAMFMIAVAGLVGMFSQQAALKLTDIANALFTKPEQGKDAAPQKGLPPDANGGATTTPAADIDPKSGSVDGGKLVKLINVSKVDSVDFGGENIVITDADFDKDKSTITLQTPRHAEGEVEVKVKDVAGKPVTLKYTYEPIGSP